MSTQQCQAWSEWPVSILVTDLFRNHPYSNGCYYFLNTCQTHCKNGLLLPFIVPLSLIGTRFCLNLCCFLLGMCRMVLLFPKVIYLAFLSKTEQRNSRTQCNEDHIKKLSVLFPVLGDRWWFQSSNWTCYFLYQKHTTNTSLQGVRYIKDPRNADSGSKLWPS